ncbi:hypothetical protein JCM10212_001733 [Sporobolomyces blumeae]
MLRPTCSLCFSSSSRVLSVASKSRRSRPPPSFGSSSSSPLSNRSRPGPPLLPDDARLEDATGPATPRSSTTRPSASRVGSATLARSAATPDSNTSRRGVRPPLPVREPPLVEKARQKSVKQRNVFESYLVLDWKTRLYFWLVIGGTAVIGLYGGDYLYPESDEEKVAKGGQVAQASVETRPTASKAV